MVLDYINCMAKGFSGGKISSVDVDLLYLHFCETKENLSEFIAISENLLNEYKQGTHTKELSRKQLEEIAHLLPPKEQWGDQVFEEKRDLIIRRYNHHNIYKSALRT